MYIYIYIHIHVALKTSCKRCYASVTLHCAAANAKHTIGGSSRKVRTSGPIDVDRSATTICICTYVYIYVYMYICTFIHIHTSCVFVHSVLYIYTYIYIYMYTHIYILPGLHPIADLTYRLKEATEMIATIVETQPKDAQTCMTLSDVSSRHAAIMAPYRATLIYIIAVHDICHL